MNHQFALEEMLKSLVCFHFVRFVQNEILSHFLVG